MRERAGDKKTYDPIEKKEHRAVCNLVVDLGEEYFAKYNKWNPKILVGFEFPDVIAEYTDNDGKEVKRPRMLTRRFKRELFNRKGEKSEFHKFLCKWVGRDLKQDAEGYTLFQPKMMLNLCGNLDVEHTKKGDSTYADIDCIRPLRPDQEKAVPTHTTLFQLDDVPDGEDPVDHFPEDVQDWVKEAFMKSKEVTTYGRAQKTPDAQAEAPPAEKGADGALMDDDSFPF